MPTLDWIGKSKVINHHLEVPFRILERKYSFDGDEKHDDRDSDNLIIHGDNLVALKALLPRFENRVRLCYIDPPYNTGNEGWVYNDNVKDPRIQKWLGEVVGKEGEDLSRHDKWLCMMYPRLRLLQKLLADDGVIFISIDDNEQANLKLICDEIFGANCFVSNISWQRTYSTRNDSKGIVNEVEHILCYSKQPGWNPKKLPRTEEMDARYKNPDNDKMPWKSSDAFAPGAATHQGMVYAIQHPFTGELIYPSSGRCWRYQQSSMLEYMLGWCEYRLENLHDEKERANVCGIDEDAVRKDVFAIVLAEPLESASIKVRNRYEKGQWPEFYFTKGGIGGIARKTYLDSVGGRLPTNLWMYSDVGHTDEAKKELISIFGGVSPFDTPKPTRLIERILQIASDPDSIILDSFAGSGTTAHAVLKANQADGGHRKFILIEMGDYADTITAERVKRAIRGYGQGKSAVAGLPGDFSYYELGPALMNGDILNEEIPTAKIREYVYYSETRQPLPPVRYNEPYLLGKHAGSAYYFYYEKNDITTLNHAFLHTVKTPAEAYVIYADLCTLNDAEMEKHHITFKKIPRDITRL